MITLTLLVLFTTIIPADNGVIVYIPLVMPYGYFIEGKQCETEDSTGCIWDAATQGNGIGESFIDVSGNAYVIFENNVVIGGDMR